VIQRALVLDLYVHQGNGTAHIFQNDPTVFTFSMHQENNYPPKQQSDLDIGLGDNTPDDLYLSLLSEHLASILRAHKPDIVHYLAGADPYWDDKLGGLQLTIDGLKARDELVFGECRQRGIPVVITLAGGYARETSHTVQIHVNTVELAIQSLQC
jgi:acetoin utilization deacetylase AcuC-like enzyme